MTTKIEVSQLDAKLIYEILDKNEGDTKAGKTGDNRLEAKTWNVFLESTGLKGKKINNNIEKGSVDKHTGAIWSLNSYLKKADSNTKQQVADYLNNLGVEFSKTSADTKATQAQATNTASPQNSTIKPTEYTVKKGDNLYNIAKKYGCSIEDLKKANNLKNDTIHPNQKLVIPQKAEPKSEVKNNELDKQENEKTTTQNTALKSFEGKTENKILVTMLDSTKASEGSKTNVYIAPEGKTTIGFGHQLKNKPQFILNIEAENISAAKKDKKIAEALKNKDNIAAFKESLQKDLQAAQATTGLTNLDSVGDNLALSEDQMKLLYYADMKNSVDAVQKRIKPEATSKLTAKQMEALVDVFYNCGGEVKAPKLIKFIEENKLDEAQAEFDFFKEKSDNKTKADGRPLGLVIRNYERMLKWGDGTLTAEAKAKILDGYNQHCDSADNKSGRQKVESFEEALKAMGY